MTPTEVALSYLEAFSSGDPERVTLWVTEDFANDQMGALGNRFKGRELYRERLRGFLGRFRGLRYAPGVTISEGDRVVVPYVMTATDDGHPIALDGVMLITVQGQLVSARADYWDGLSYFQQMGVALPEGAQGSRHNREGGRK